VYGPGRTAACPYCATMEDDAHAAVEIATMTVLLQEGIDGGEEVGMGGTLPQWD